MPDTTPFHGLSAFPLTPADGQGRVDTETLARLLERVCVAGVDSVGLLGSTGVYAYLTREERRRAVAAAAECIGGRRSSSASERCAPIRRRRLPATRRPPGPMGC